MNEALNKFSQRWNEDYFVAYKKKDGTWTKWYLLSEWPFDYEPNYRQIVPNELVIETDLSREENERIAALITLQFRNKNKGFYAAFTGNKSIHIHSFWEGLEELTPEQRTKAKELIAKWVCGETYCGEEIYSKIDKANFKPKRLILIFGAKHPKTGKKKELWLEPFEPEKINCFPDWILEEAKKVQEPVFTGVSFKPSKCPFIDFALSHALAEGTDRNLHLVPNLVALTQDVYLWELCADVQGKKLSEFENWAKRKPKFNCSQLRKYAESVGKGTICTSHLLEGFK